jgi:GNAT superfamily N-acetyltransferase
MAWQNVPIPPPSGIAIVPLASGPAIVDMLADILVEVVAGGASVHFIHPLASADAVAFWQNSFAAAARGERVIFGAWEGEAVVGTVTLQLAMPPNQPHRAEIAKMMTRPGHHGRGIGRLLLEAAEARARVEGRSLLVLDTAVDGGASVFYARLGYVEAGVIPDYAIRPHGGLTGSRFFWKKLAPAP